MPADRKCRKRHKDLPVATVIPAKLAEIQQRAGTKADEHILRDIEVEISGDEEMALFRKLWD